MLREAHVLGDVLVRTSGSTGCSYLTESETAPNERSASRIAARINSFALVGDASDASLDTTFIRAIPSASRVDRRVDSDVGAYPRVIARTGSAGRRSSGGASSAICTEMLLPRQGDTTYASVVP